MSDFRFILSAVSASLSVWVVGPVSGLDTAFAQRLEEAAALEKAAQIEQQAIQLYMQGRYAEAEQLTSARWGSEKNFFIQIIPMSQHR